MSSAAPPLLVTESISEDIFPMRVDSVELEGGEYILNWGLNPGIPDSVFSEEYSRIKTQLEMISFRISIDVLRENLPPQLAFLGTNYIHDPSKLPPEPANTEVALSSVLTPPDMYSMIDLEYRRRHITAFYQYIINYVNANNAIIRSNSKLLPYLNSLFVLFTTLFINGYNPLHMVSSVGLDIPLICADDGIPVNMVTSYEKETPPAHTVEGGVSMSLGAATELQTRPPLIKVQPLARKQLPPIYPPGRYANTTYAEIAFGYYVLEILTIIHKGTELKKFTIPIITTQNIVDRAAAVAGAGAPRSGGRRKSRKHRKSKHSKKTLRRKRRQ